jgi:hypothetical protein
LRSPQNFDNFASFFKRKWTTIATGTVCAILAVVFVTISLTNCVMYYAIIVSVLILCSDSGLWEATLVNATAETLATIAGVVAVLALKMNLWKRRTSRTRIHQSMRQELQPT